MFGYETCKTLDTHFVVVVVVVRVWVATWPDEIDAKGVTGAFVTDNLLDLNRSSPF